jgi:hypothetical protein
MDIVASGRADGWQTLKSDRLCRPAKEKGLWTRARD